MNTTVFDNIIIDVVRTANDENNPTSLTDEQCEQILQDNVKEDGSILDNERALLSYSEKLSGIPISRFTQNNIWFWVRQGIILLIVFGVSYWLMNKTIDPDQDIIYIDIVFWRYCFLQLFIWFIFWMISWGVYFCKDKKESKDKNSWATFFLANPFVIYKVHAICQWIWYGFKYGCCFLYYLFLVWQKKETDFSFPRKPNEAFDRSSDNSSKKSNTLPYDRVIKHLLDNEYIKYSVLLIWKFSICLALAFGIIFLNFSFRNNKLHDYGFTIGDSWSFDFVQDWHVSVIDFITRSHDHYKYLHELKGKIRNAKKEDLVKYYSKQIQEEENKKQINKELVESISNSIKELEDKNLLPEHMIRYGMNETSKDYDKAGKADTFGNFCFNYMIWCLVTPVLPHGFYFIIYLYFWLKERRQESIKCLIKTGDNGIIIDPYQFRVLGDLRRQYKNICRKKMIWLQISEESGSDIRLFDLKSFCDKNEENNNIFLENNDAVKDWIEIQNGLPERPHQRTLVCLCDINQPISIDCVKFLSRLTNSGKYDIRIALVYDNNLRDNYQQNQDAVLKQLEKRKSELESLEEGFSEKYVCVYSMDSQLDESENWRMLEDSVKNSKDAPGYNLTLDQAFEKIIKDITPLTPTVVDSPKPPVVDPPKLPIPVSQELITLAGRFLPIKPLPPPEQQPLWITLVIFNGVEQNDFLNKFNEYAGSAQKSEKRFYQKISDSNVLNDIIADQSRNQPVEYRIILIAKVNSPFGEGNQQKLREIIVQILSKEQNRSLQVFVVATDIESSRNDGYDVESYLDGWGKIVGKLKNQYGTNVEFTFEDKFDYPIAPQSVWTKFCSKVFPEADIEVVELPTPEERKKKFAEAVKAIRSASEFVFDNELDDNVCLNQEALLFNAIHDIYSSKGMFNLDGFVTGLTNLRKKGLDSLSKIKDNLPSVDDIKIVTFFKSLINNSLEGSVAGGVLAVAAPFIGLPAVGIVSGMMLGGSIELLVEKWRKARADRRKARTEEDSTFKAKSEAEQNRILQVESLIASGLTWTIVYDGQGYPEEEITETIKQVLQPLELVHIFNKEGIVSFLDAAQSRWENRCSIN